MGRAAKLKIRRKAGLEKSSPIYIRRLGEGLYNLKYREIEMTVGANSVDEVLLVLKLYLRERALGNPLTLNTTLYAVRNSQSLPAG